MKKSAGLGLRHSFHNTVLETKPAVPWFEVITENYLFFDGHPRNFLRQIRANYPLVFHGVSLSIGSLEPIRNDYLQQLKKLIAEFKPLWVSDHLCWTYNGTENSHDLLPVPFTKESLNRISTKVQQVQDFLGQKIYLENPSAYVDFAQNEYLEEDFIAELCNRAGCGLLLDLNNLVVNQYNLGYQPANYLEKIKNVEVRQIHLAGHTIKEKVRIDTHDHDISQDVLDLLPLAKSLWPDANPMIEWDDKIPPLDYLLEQRTKIDRLWNADPALIQAIKTQPNEIKAFKPASDQQLHHGFWELLKKEDVISDQDTLEAGIFKNELPTPSSVGMNVYSSAYYSRIIEVLEKDFPVLKNVLDELFAHVMMEYLKVHPSTFDSIDFVGNKLATFFKEHAFDVDLGVDQKIIADVAAFENLSGLCSIAFSDTLPNLAVREFSEDDWTNCKLTLKPYVLLYRANCEIHHVIEAVKQAEIPEVPELKTSYYLFYRDGLHSHYRMVSETEFFFFDQFLQPRSFVAALGDDAEKIQSYSQILFKNENLFSVAK